MRPIASVLTRFIGLGGSFWLGSGPAHARGLDSVSSGPILVLALMAVTCGALVLAISRRHRASAAEEKARYFARHEPMTGLFNRPHFIKALDELMQQRAAHEQVAVLCIDLDGLREINDLLGHETGDEAILRAAGNLRKVSGPDALVARLSGDKFAVARRTISVGDIKDHAGAMLSAISQPFTTQGQDVALVAQIGVALTPSDGDTALRLLKSAGLALDRARLRQGSCFVFFERTLETELQRRRELEQQIRDTLAAKAFDLHFQPLLETTQQHLVGFEALLRMPDGKGGFVSPAIFIPVAEEIGLIIEIGDWVVRRACALASLWPDHLTVAVNLSPAQFKAGGVCRTVKEALESVGLAPHRLELEITEGLILNDDAAIMRELTELKALGVSIVMDDFGTGYSSLSYLWKFPFDKIKIDRSFMRGLNGEDGSIVDVLHAIMSLSRALRMRVTAEGVETSLQAEFLKTIGCHEVQGFYFGKPMPTEQVALAILRDVRGDETIETSHDDGRARRLATGR